nr:MAG TPA: hypothetical protein [Caudoviricetes sp.]
MRLRTVVEEICKNCSLIGFTKFGKGDLSQSFPPELV